MSRKHTRSRHSIMGIKRVVNAAAPPAPPIVAVRLSDHLLHSAHHGRLLDEAERIRESDPHVEDVSS